MYEFEPFITDEEHNCAKEIIIIDFNGQAPEVGDTAVEAFLRDEWENQQISGMLDKAHGPAG